MAVDLRVDLSADGPEMGWYRETRGIDPGSAEWAHIREWFANCLRLNVSGFPESLAVVVDPALLDAEMERFRAASGQRTRWNAFRTLWWHLRRGWWHLRVARMGS